MFNILKKLVTSTEEIFLNILNEAIAGHGKAIGELELILDKEWDVKKEEAIKAQIKKAEFPTDILAWQYPEDFKDKKNFYACALWLQGILLKKENNHTDANKYFAQAVTLNYGPAILAAVDNPSVFDIMLAAKLGSQKAVTTVIDVSVFLQDSKIELAKLCYETINSSAFNKDFFSKILKNLVGKLKSQLDQQKKLTIEEFKILYYAHPAFPEKRNLSIHGHVENSAPLTIIIERLIAHNPDEFEKIYKEDQCRNSAGRADTVLKELEVKKHKRLEDQKKQQRAYTIPNTNRKEEEEPTFKPGSLEEKFNSL